MMTLSLIIACLQATLLAVSIVLSVQRYRRASTTDPWEKALTALTPIAIYIMASLLLKELLEAPFGTWNAARLSPTFAIRHGYQLYYPATKGPVLDTLYGPVVAWVYLPATFAHTPTVAMLIAECISILLYFLPILFLLKVSGTTSTVRSMSVLCAFLIFAFLTFQSVGLHWSAFLIHADAPALGLGAFSLVFVNRFLKGSSVWALGMSALLAVLSSWAKQTMAPLCIAIVIFIFLAQGFRSALRYLIALGISFLIVTGFILHLYNPQALIFNLITAPSHQQWIIPSDNTLASSRLGALVWGFKDLLHESYWIWVLFCFLSYWNNRHRSQLHFDWRRWLTQSSGGLLFLVSLFLTSGAILGRIKEGGENNFSLCVYFLLAAAVMELGVALKQHFSRQKSIEMSPIAMMTTLLLGLSLLYFAPTLSRLPPYVQQLFHNPQQYAYIYLKAHPSEVYFPTDPLPALMANGKLYHYSEGIHDRERAGFPLSQDHFFSGIPPNLKYIAVYPINQSNNYFPTYNQPVSVPDLPLWLVLKKS